MINENDTVSEEELGRKQKVEYKKTTFGYLSDKANGVKFPNTIGALDAARKEIEAAKIKQNDLQQAQQKPAQEDIDPYDLANGAREFMNDRVEKDEEREK